MARVPAILFGIATVYVAMAGLKDLVSMRAAIMAGLILVTHVIVGMSFALADLLSKGGSHAATAS